MVYFATGFSIKSQHCSAFNLGKQRAAVILSQAVKQYYCVWNNHVRVNNFPYSILLINPIRAVYVPQAKASYYPKNLKFLSNFLKPTHIQT